LRNPDVFWDVYLTAVILPALSESERLAGALDHSFARRRFLLLHLDSLLDL
jgi:hypothetical protein